MATTEDPRLDGVRDGPPAAAGTDERADELVDELAGVPGDGLPEYRGAATLRPEGGAEKLDAVAILRVRRDNGWLWWSGAVMIEGDVSPILGRRVTVTTGAGDVGSLAIISQVQGLTPDLWTAMVQGQGPAWWAELALSPAVPAGAAGFREAG
jgi:hypothetical protein